MRRTTRIVTAAVAAGSLLAMPVVAPADPGKGKGKTKRCAKTPKVGYSVTGTFVSAVADNPLTPAHEGTMTITVTGANSHARKSGEIADQNASAEGVQVAGATYTVPSTDRFTLTLVGYEGADTPSPGDAVQISGKILRTKHKCAPAGTSLADRYGAVDVRKVTVTDSDPDA